MIIKLLTEHHLEFLSLKGGCSGSSESTHVKMPHCWKSHATAHFLLCRCILCIMGPLPEYLHTYLDKTFKVSAHICGQGTNLNATWPLAEE